MNIFKHFHFLCSKLFCRGGSSYDEYVETSAEIKRIRHEMFSPSRGFRSDRVAMRGDWIKVGNDMRKALGHLDKAKNEYDSQHKSNTTIECIMS